YITPTLFVALIASIILVPLCRALLRQCLANKPWWGYPTVIFGDGETATLMARTLIAEPGFGLRLVAVFDKTEAENRAELGDQVAVLPDLAHAAAVARNLNSPYAVIAMPSTQPDDLMEMIEEYISPYFSRILLIPNLFRWSSLWIKPKTFGDILGLEVVQQSALP